jgi:cellulose 1,4-beta-cellobiosidase
VIEIKRNYVPGGNVIDNSFTKLDSLSKQCNSVSDEFCVQKKAFGDNDSLTKHGGFRQLDASLNKRYVLVLALSDDHDVHDVDMLWLDSVYPTNSNKAGSDRGACKSSSAVPADVKSQAAHRVEAAALGVADLRERRPRPPAVRDPSRHPRSLPASAIRPSNTTPIRRRPPA